MAIKWMCRVGLHPWGKWANGPWLKTVDEGESFWWAIRSCEACGKQQRRVRRP